jgi:hypothetical protein
MTLELFLKILPLWFQAFAFTLAVEVPVFAAVARLPAGPAPKARAPLWRLAVAGAAGTCVTHPSLWFLWPQVVSDYTTYIVSGELLVAAIESATFFALAQPITWRRAVAASLSANAASFGLGLLLRAIGLLG